MDIIPCKIDVKKAVIERGRPTKQKNYMLYMKFYSIMEIFV